MQEERDIEGSASSSAITPILVVVGALAGLSLLVCGGAAGYVALTTPARDASTGTEQEAPTAPPHLQKMMEMEAKAKQIPFTADAAVVNKIAATIFKIDLPADFEPIEARKDPYTMRAVYGRPTEDSALLKMAVSVWHLPGVESLSIDDEKTARDVLRIAEDEYGRTPTVLKVTRQKKEHKQRELMVLGQKALFTFKQGKRASDNKPVWKVWGAFGTKFGAAALILLIPESEYDEEAVVRMIEAIRPADDVEPDPDGKSEAEESKLEKADDASKREGARE